MNYFSFSIINLFQDFQDVDIKPRLFIDEPRVFREAQVKTVVGLMTQKLNTDEPDENFLASTKLFVEIITSNKQAKEALSRGFRVLLEPLWKLSVFQNGDTPRVCDLCDERWNHIGLVPYKSLSGGTSGSPDPDATHGILYQGEVFYRFPGCEVPIRFSAHRKLKVRDLVQHDNKTFAACSTSLSVEYKKALDDELERLALCLKVSADQCGESPIPERWWKPRGVVDWWLDGCRNTKDARGVLVSKADVLVHDKRVVWRSARTITAVSLGLYGLVDMVLIFSLARAA